MSNNQSEIDNSQYDALKIQVYQMEYEKLREEMMHYINPTHQIPTYTIGTASILIPILLSQTIITDPYFISVILYGLTIFFSIMLLNFSTTLTML